MPSKIIAPLKNNDELPTINWFLDLSKPNWLTSNINNTKNTIIGTEKYAKKSIKLKKTQNINPKIKEVFKQKDNQQIIKKNKKEDKKFNDNLISQKEQNLNQIGFMEQENKQKQQLQPNYINQNKEINTNQTLINDDSAYSFLEHSIYGIDNFTATNSQVEYLSASYFGNSATLNYGFNSFFSQEWEDELFQNSGNLF